MVDPERLELPTPAFEAQCSIQLSYGSALGLENKRIRSGLALSRCIEFPVSEKNSLTGLPLSRIVNAAHGCDFQPFPQRDSESAPPI